jgi:Domain of unknown function (DUF4386)
MTALENLATEPEKVSSREAWLYWLGCAAAVVAVVIFRRWLSSEFLLFRAIGIVQFGPKAPPNSAAGWFTLLHAHPVIGFTLLNGFDTMTFVLAGVVYFALYIALRRTVRDFMIVALALSVAGIVLYIASNPAFPMLRLSSQYTAATTDAQRSMILAAGEQVIASKNPFAIGQNLAFIFFNAGGLILSTAMLRSGIFTKRTAWLGILFNTFAFGFPLGVALAPGNPMIPGVAWVIAVFFWLFWYIGIARAFWRLAHGKS